MNELKDAKTKNVVSDLVNEAKEEVNEERRKQFKTSIKIKLKSLATAQEVVKNIQREITDMEIEIAEKLA